MGIEWRLLVHSQKLVLGHPVKEQKRRESKRVDQGHTAEVKHAEQEYCEGFGIEKFDVEDLPFEFFLHFLLSWFVGGTTLITFF